MPPTFFNVVKKGEKKVGRCSVYVREIVSSSLPFFKLKSLFAKNLWLSNKKACSNMHFALPGIRINLNFYSVVTQALIFKTK